MRTRGRQKPAQRFSKRQLRVSRIESTPQRGSSWPTSADLHRSFDNFRAAADARLVLFRVAGGSIRTSTTKNRAANPKWEVTPTPGTYHRLSSSLYPFVSDSLNYVKFHKNTCSCLYFPRVSFSVRSILCFGHTIEYKNDRKFNVKVLCWYIMNFSNLCTETIFYPISNARFVKLQFLFILLVL